ncbi:MAG: hypothetical protein P9L99_17980 [Candidatus Lernaella stagnicola]|nr:hypothetical protein [Candidatus Lernaella stagnicola]
MTETFTPSPLLQQALTGDGAARFLATRGADDQPSLVPALSARRDGDELRLAAVLPDRVLHDLGHDPRSALLVIDQRMNWWNLQTEFVAFEDGAPGDPIGRWGRLRPVAVTAAGRISSLRLTIEYAVVRMFGIARGDDYPHELPQEVAQRFSMLKAVKSVAYLDEDGKPLALPCFSMVPAGSGALVCGTGTVAPLRDIPAGAPVAICLLTFQPQAYQIHGWFEGVGGGLLPHAASIKVGRLVPALA